MHIDSSDSNVVISTFVFLIIFNGFKITKVVNVSVDERVTKESEISYK